MRGALKERKAYPKAPCRWGRGFLGEKKCCRREIPRVGCRGQWGQSIFALCSRSPALPAWCPVAEGGPVSLCFPLPSRHELLPLSRGTARRRGWPARGGASPLTPQPAGPAGVIFRLLRPLPSPFSSASTFMALEAFIFPERTGKKSMSGQFRFCGKVHFCLILRREETCGAHYSSTWNSPLS